MVSRASGAAVADALHRIRANIEAACERAGRDPDEVKIVGVTKTLPIELVREAREAGLRDLAENYANELARKAEAVDATWHFIGTLQRGTATRVAQYADVVQSLSPGGGLDRLSRRADREGREIVGLVQVDYTGRRHGVPAEDVEAFVREAGSRPGIRVVGLMTVPPLGADAEAARPYFRDLRRARDRLRERWHEVRELSMGMSLDYAVAVEEGATMVRVGTALFGERPGRGAGRLA